MRKLIVTGCYFGFSPFAPGTAGTLPAVALYLLVAQTPCAEALNVALLLLFSALSIWLAPWAEAHWGKKDPKPFVLDEMAGYFMAILFLPTAPLLLKATVGFFAARAMDVVKPFPARRLEALPGGWGILLDDLVASVYANAIARLGLWWWLVKCGGGQ